MTLKEWIDMLQRMRLIHGEDAANLEAIAAIEQRGHIAVAVRLHDEIEIREYVDDATEAAAQEAFWRCRAADRGEVSTD